MGQGGGCLENEDSVETLTGTGGPLDFLFDFSVEFVLSLRTLLVLQSSDDGN